MKKTILIVIMTIMLLLSPAFALVTTQGSDAGFFETIGCKLNVLSCAEGENGYIVFPMAIQKIVNYDFRDGDSKIMTATLPVFEKGEVIKVCSKVYFSKLGENDPEMGSGWSKYFSDYQSQTSRLKYQHTGPDELAYDYDKGYYYQIITETGQKVNKYFDYHHNTGDTWWTCIVSTTNQVGIHEVTDLQVSATSLMAPYQIGLEDNPYYFKFKTVDSSGNNNKQYCGDGACNNGETFNTCAEDCGWQDSNVCGDGNCAGNEDVSNCPGDCDNCIGVTCQNDFCQDSDTLYYHGECSLEFGACVYQTKSCGNGCNDGACLSGTNPDKEGDEAVESGIFLKLKHWWSGLNIRDKFIVLFLLLFIFYKRKMIRVKI